MNIELSKFIGRAVLEFDSGDLLAQVSGVVIHPDTGKVEALWVRPATIPLKYAIIQTGNILELKKNVYIRDDSVIIQAEEVIRIADILEKRRQILGNIAKGTSGKTYGHVYNLSFDTEHYALTSIYVAHTLFGIFKSAKRIFAAKDIVKVLPDYILINDDSSSKESAFDSGEVLAG